jgi:hypothetical protein
MSTISTTERPSALQQGRLAVPWKTVLLLAVVMAYADGYWLQALRGAVGAIERTQEPFASWLRESTVVLPVFVLAVLGALTLALRCFGPELRRPRTVVATVLLIVAAGTVVGLAAIVASSAYDYHLQSNQLQMMGSMNGSCTGNCLSQGQDATLALHVQAVTYISGWILLTNLALVAWLVAICGGRLKVSTTRPTHDGLTDTQPPAGSSLVQDLRLTLVGMLVACAAINAAVVPKYLTEWAGAGLFFMLLTVGQLAVAYALFARLEERIALMATAVMSILPIGLWLFSNPAGRPFGPGAGLSEGVGLPVSLACALAACSLLAAVLMLRAHGWLGRRPPASAHVRGLVLVALVAVIAIGVSATGLSWFDAFGISGSQPVMEMDMDMSH